MIEDEGSALLCNHALIYLIIAGEAQINRPPVKIHVLNCVFIRQLAPIASLLECSHHVDGVVALGCSERKGSLKLLSHRLFH